MNRCEVYLELLSASLDGTLTPEEAARLDAHLATCPACRKVKAELEAVHAALQSLPAAEPPAGLYDRIMDAVAADNVVPFAAPAKKKPVFRWRKWGAAAAMFAVILVGYGAMNGPDKKAPTALSTPEPSTEAAGFITDASGNAQPRDRSVEIQTETDTAALSEEQEPAEETAAVAPRTVPDAPLESAPAPQPTAEPTFKAASAQGGEMETSETQPPAMVRSFVTAALPSEEAPVENETETGDSPDISLFVAANGLTGPETTPSPDPEIPAADEPTEVPPPSNDCLPQGSEGDSGEEVTAVAMTAREALDRLLAEYPFPGCEEWEHEEIEEGWQSPAWTAEDGSSCWLQYEGIPYEVAHEFCSYAEEPEGLHALAGFSVPIDGGEITIAGN